MEYIFYGIGFFLIGLVYNHIYDKTTKRLNIQGVFSSVNLQLALAAGIFFIYYGCQNEAKKNMTIAEAQNYVEATQVVDKRISDLNDRYNKLCGSPRNDQLKEKFLELATDVQSLSICGQMCEKIAYDGQVNISKYAEKKIGENESLKKLLSGQISCW
jgi:hypothetical protein